MFLHGINIPDHKLVHLALQRINGIGPKVSTQICSQLCIGPRQTVRDLPEHKVNKLSEHLSSMTIGSEKRKEMVNDIQQLIKLGTYRGVRHVRGLPVRGQKTHPNGKTARAMNFIRTRTLT